MSYMGPKICIRMCDMWQPVLGYEDLYEASDDGHVRSLERTTVFRDGRKRTFPGVLLKGTPDADGYLRVGLSRSGKQVSCLVSRVVLGSFNPEPKGGALALHRDDVRTNNHLSNLYWGTGVHNQDDAFTNGGRRLRDRCVNDHLVTGDNIYRLPNSKRGRVCRQCALDANRRHTGVVKHYGRRQSDRCRNGHSYDPENTYYEPKTGVRHCRQCRRDNKRKARR